MGEFKRLESFLTLSFIQQKQMPSLHISPPPSPSQHFQEKKREERKIDEAEYLREGPRNWWWGGDDKHSSWKSQINI